MDLRAEEIFLDHQKAIFRRTDRLFAILLVVQYFGSLIAAGVAGSRTDFFAALAIGFAINFVPIALVITRPGHTLTRHVIAAAQIIAAGLLAHLMAGRLETHFHVFASLAFLGFYRDWRVLITASLMIAAEPFIRDVYWEGPVDGWQALSHYRWIELSVWVVLEDLFLTAGIRMSSKEMVEIAVRRASIENLAHERAESITELEDARVQLKTALRARDEFISVCGHELKTPITTLNLLIQLTQKSLRENQLRTGSTVAQAVPQHWLSVEMQSDVIDQTESQVKRLLRLVQDMLDHSRIKNGALPAQPAELDVADLVTSAVEQCRPLATDAGSSLLSYAGNACPAYWDRHRIEQVLINLITNAIKYGNGRPIEVRSLVTQKWARISVKDNGMGIDPANFEKIFNQFERVLNLSHISGLGLGLFITKGIVESHGGSIEVQSRLGEGSTFIVVLPLRPDFYQQREATAPTELHAHLQKT